MLQESMTNLPLTKTEPHRLTFLDAALYAGIIFAWSKSCYPLTLQISIIAPEGSLLWRFLAACSVMFAFLIINKKQIRFKLKDHARFALSGVLIFSTNFLLFYYAADGVTSGLLSVIFSTASIISLILATLTFRQK